MVGSGASVWACSWGVATTTSFSVVNGTTGAAMTAEGALGVTTGLVAVTDCGAGVVLG